MSHTMTPKRPYLFRSMYEWLCDNNVTPYLVVDATIEGVIVPQEHVSDGQIVLNLAPHAIGYINIEDHGVAFSARFSGKSMDLYAPITAIMALYAKENGEGMVFPPEEFPKSNQPPLSVADSEPQTSAEESNPSETKKPSKKKGAHLKVIK